MICQDTFDNFRYFEEKHVENQDNQVILWNDHDSPWFQDVPRCSSWFMFPDVSSHTTNRQTNDLEPPDTLQSYVRCVCALAQLLAPLLHAKPIESDVPWGTLHQTATENRRRGYGTLLPGCWKQSLHLSINIIQYLQTPWRCKLESLSSPSPMARQMRAPSTAVLSSPTIPWKARIMGTTSREACRKTWKKTSWLLSHPLPMRDPAGAGRKMLTWLGYIDGIHVTIYSRTVRRLETNHGNYGSWSIIQEKTCK